MFCGLTPLIVNLIFDPLYLIVLSFIVVVAYTAHIWEAQWVDTGVHARYFGRSILD